jgi:hypothetical protein
MTALHWWFIGLSWAATLAVFGALSLFALVRHRNARRQLAQLESRTPKSRTPASRTQDGSNGEPQGGNA